MMYKKYAPGIIEVITGPMFSGKSEELIKRIKILGYSQIKTLVIKPSVDNRWDKLKIISRAGVSIDTQEVSSSKDILDLFSKNEYQAIAIDEVQFLDEGIVEVVSTLANKGVRVIVSGLDMDFAGKPFKMMPQLLAIADFVDKERAVCVVCHNAATMTYRKSNEQVQIAIGNNEYEPRCRDCHQPKKVV